MVECKDCKHAKENWEMDGSCLTTFQCRYNPPTHDGFPQVSAGWWCSKGEKNE